MLLTIIVLFSAWIDTGYANINLALRKPTNQISVKDGYDSSLAVNGNPTNCSQISIVDNPARPWGWWLVDLKMRYVINSVHIETTQYADPLENFTITVWEVDPGPLIGRQDAVYCTCFYYPGRLPDQGRTTMNCPPNCIGRFVAIIGFEELSSICEVYVYGEFEPMVGFVQTVLVLDYDKRAVQPNSNYTIATTLSSISCARLCREWETCLGFNYKTSSQVQNCQMYGKSINPDNIQAESGWFWVTFKKIITTDL